MSIDKKIKKKLSNNKKIQNCAAAFGITGDETRLKICYLLCHHPELSVSEIAEALDAPISTISHSLSKLKSVCVVKSRRQSKIVFYSFEDNEFVYSLKNQLLA